MYKLNIDQHVGVISADQWQWKKNIIVEKARYSRVQVENTTRRWRDKKIALSCREFRCKSKAKEDEKV